MNWESVAMSMEQSAREFRSAAETHLTFGNESEAWRHRTMEQLLSAMAKALRFGLPKSDPK